MHPMPEAPHDIDSSREDLRWSDKRLILAKSDDRAQERLTVLVNFLEQLER